VNPLLAALAFRRSVTRGFVLGALALAAVVVASQRAPTLDTGSAIAREGVWTVLILCLAPVLVRRAAATVGVWRSGEIDWLAKAPVARATVIVSAWLGTFAAALSVTGVIALAAELASPDAGACERRVGTTPAPANLVLDGTAPARWIVDDRPTGEVRARVYLAFVPIAVAADVEFVARDLSTREERLARARIASRTTLEVAVPRGNGPVELELRRVGAGGIVLLAEQRVDWLVTSSSARAASLATAAHVALAFAAWLAIALGLGAWMGGGIATASALALTLPGWLAENGGLRSAWPAADLAETLDLVGRGVIPDLPSGTAVLGSVLGTVVGLALALAGTRTWRSPT